MELKLLRFFMCAVFVNTGVWACGSEETALDPGSLYFEFNSLGAGCNIEDALAESDAGLLRCKSPKGLLNVFHQVGGSNTEFRLTEVCMDVRNIEAVEVWDGRAFDRQEFVHSGWKRFCPEISSGLRSSLFMDFFRKSGSDQFKIRNLVFEGCVPA